VANRFGFLGPPGTFGEEAARLYQPAAEFVPLASNRAVVTAVQDAQVDQGIAPIENSLDGGIPETVDALLQYTDVYIQDEIVLPVEHNLIAAHGTRLAQITVVTSHPSALAQCRTYLQANLPHARLEAALSTAAAVESAVPRPGVAAIGTRRAAQLAGGEVLAGAIQDVAHNKTRFLILGPRPAARRGDDNKTSIAFTVAHDQPGTLLGVLKELADRRINMTRIESRPSREDLGIYIFLIDFQGHHEDPVVAEALKAVQARAHYFRLFGSYPRFA
jgi:prephenate dehydratase